jgi:hypothetical protein
MLVRYVPGAGLLALAVGYVAWVGAQDSVMSRRGSSSRALPPWARGALAALVPLAFAGCLAGCLAGCQALPFAAAPTAAPTATPAGADACWLAVTQATQEFAVWRASQHDAPLAARLVWQWQQTHRQPPSGWSVSSPGPYTVLVRRLVQDILTGRLAALVYNTLLGAPDTPCPVATVGGLPHQLDPGLPRPWRLVDLSGSGV